MRWTRLAIALTLAVAIGAVPLAAAQCDVTCGEALAASTAVAARARAADPTCRRAKTRVTHVDNVPTSCGHDHAGINRAISDPPQLRALTAPIVAVLPAVASVAAQRALQARGHPSTSPPGAFARLLGSSLRI